jgi:hypothetical protein
LLLTNLEELYNIGYDNESSSKDGSVSRLGFIYNIASKNDINRARHTSSRNVTGKFLKSDLLPIKENTLVVD